MSSSRNYYKVTDRKWTSFTGEPIGAGDTVVHRIGPKDKWVVMGESTYLASQKGADPDLWLHRVEMLPELGKSAGWNVGERMIKVLPDWTEKDIQFHLALIGAIKKEDE